MKRFLYYFIWTIVIGLIIYFGAKLQFAIQEEASANLVIMPTILSATTLYVAIGALLRIPRLVIEIEENRPWTFDWIKFIAVGVPSFCILLLFVLLYTSIGQSIINIVPGLFPYMVFLGNQTIQMVAGVVFGYILLDSLKKDITQTA